MLMLYASKIGYFRDTGCFRALVLENANAKSKENLEF